MRGLRYYPYFKGMRHMGLRVWQLDHHKLTFDNCTRLPEGSHPTWGPQSTALTGGGGKTACAPPVLQCAYVFVCVCVCVCLCV
jgi:hypothetical protein